MEVEVEPPVGWKRQRKLTKYVFVIEAFLLGLEYSISFLTLWVYLEQVTDTLNQQKKFYSLISVAYFISPVLFGFYFGKILDRTRKVKVSFLIGNACIIGGNIMYSIPYSPYCLLTGRFIAGVGISLRSIMTAELTRCYEENDSIKIFSLIMLVFNIGYIVGPVFAMPCIDININWCHLKITYGNAPIMILSLLYIIQYFLVVAFVHDLSRIYDLKYHEKKRQANKDETSTEVKRELDDKQKRATETTGETQQLIPTEKTKIKYLAKFSYALEAYVLFFLSFLYSNLMVLFDMWIPVIVIHIIGWNVKSLNIILLALAICSVIACFVTSKFTLPKQFIGAVFISSFWMATGALIILYSICRFKLTNIAIVALFVVLVIVWSLLDYVEEAYLATALAKMVPSSKQNLTECIRESFSSLGSVIALASGIYILDCLLIFVIFYAAVLLCFFFIVICRKNYFLA